MFESMLGRRLLFSVATAIACALIVTPAIGTERRQDLRRELVGSWRLVSFVVRNANGSTVAYPFGEDAIGKLTYTADGNAWALVRAKSLSAAEIAAALFGPAEQPSAAEPTAAQPTTREPDPGPSTGDDPYAGCQPPKMERGETVDAYQQRVRADLDAHAERRDAERRAADRAANERGSARAPQSPDSLEQAIAAAAARQREAENKSEAQLLAEANAAIGWLLAQPEAKMERQTADVFGGNPDRDVEGRAPLSTGLPTEHERERDDDDPFDPRSR